MRYLIFILFISISCTHAELPSRSQQSDKNGFYQLPSGLADDYPSQNASESEMRKDFEIIRESGSKYFRVGISWHETEIAPGQFDWSRWDRLFSLADEYKIKLIPYVCYTPLWAASDQNQFWSSSPKNPETFANFVKQIVQRYKGRALSWELWNEPDIADYWRGTPEDFLKMIVPAAKVLRSIDPQAKVILGGMAQPLLNPFFERILKNPEIGANFDVFNLHGYYQTWNPQPLEEYPERFKKIKSLVDKFAPGKELWLAEFGYSELGRSRIEQARGLWISHIMAASSEVLSLMTWYRIKDLPGGTKVIGDSHNLHLGVVTVEGKKKAAFYMLKIYNQLFDQPFRVVRSAAKNIKEATVVLFQKIDGNFIATAWSTNAQVQKVQLQLPDGFQVTDISVTNKRVWIAEISGRKPHQVQTIPLLDDVKTNQTEATNEVVLPNQRRLDRPILQAVTTTPLDESQKIAQ